MKKKLLVWIIVAVAVLMIPLFVLTGKSVISSVDLFDANSEIEQEKTVQKDEDEDKGNALKLEYSDDNKKSETVADKLKEKLESQQEEETVSEEDIAKQNELLELNSSVQKKVEEDESLSSAYAGEYLDEGELVICVTDKKASDKIKAQVSEELSNVSSNYIDKNDIEYKVVEYSKETLDNTKKALDDKNSTIDKSSLTSEQSDVLSRLVSYGVDYEENCVSVGIQEYKENDKDTFESIFGLNSSLKYHEQAPVSLASTYKPGRGIYIDTGGRVSIGYKAFKDLDSNGVPSSGDVYGFITCAHGVYERKTNYVYSSTTYTEDNIIGTVYENGFEFDSSNYRMDYSFIKLAPTSQMSNYTEYENRLISEIGTVMQGATVWKEGSTSPYTDNAIVCSCRVSHCGNDSYDFNSIDLALTGDGMAREGDSGGVVYQLGPNGIYQVVGINVLGSASDNEPDEDRYTYFLRADKIRDKRGIYLHTGDETNPTSIVTSGTCGENLDWYFKNSTLTIKLKTGAKQGEMYDYYSAPWANYCEKIKKVVIADGVTNIGDYAFYNCYNLTEINIGKNVKNIGYNAFAWCINLESVKLPASVNSIEFHAFYRCKKLSSVWFLGGQPQDIDDYAFEDLVLVCHYPLDKDYEYINYGGNITWVVYDPASEDINVSGYVDYMNSSIRLSWTAQRQEEVYDVLRKESQTGQFEVVGTVSDIEWSDSNIVPGNTYWYKVILHDTETMESNVISIYCGPAPESVTINNKENYNKLVISWSTVKGASYYEIFGSKTKDGFYEKKDTVKSTTYQTSEECFYKIRAKLDGYLLSDAVLGVTAPEVPIIKEITLDGETGTPIISWDVAKGADDYAVALLKSVDGSVQTVVGTNKERTFNHTAAKEGNTYFYKVYSCRYNSVNGALVSSEYSDIVGITCGELPFKLNISTDEKGVHYLTWDSINGASEYEVYCLLPNTHTYTLLGKTKNAFYSNEEVKVDKNYHYQIRTVIDKNYKYSTISSVVSHSKPKIMVSNDVLTGKPVIKFDEKSSGNSIYCSTEKYGEYTKISHGTASHTHNDAIPGKKYYYKANLSGVDLYSDVVEIVCAYPQPIIKVINDGSGKPMITWKRTSNTVYYEVSCATSIDGNYNVLSNNSESSFIHKQAQLGDNYFYKVRVKNYGSSAYSNIAQIVCGYDTPIINRVVNDGETNDSIISWEVVDRADGYNVYYLNEKNQETLLGYTKDTTFSHRNTQPGKEYQYVIRAIFDDSGVVSAPSDPVINISGYNSPEVSVSNDKLSGEIKIVWGEVEGINKKADKYYIYMSSNRYGEYRQCSVVEDNICIYQGTNTGEHFYFKVKAYWEDEDIYSTESNVVDGIMECGAIDFEVINNVYSGKPVLFFDKLYGSNINGYEIYFSTDGVKYSDPIIVNKVDNFTHDEAEVGKKYFYKLRSISCKEPTIYSEFTEVKTIVCKPATMNVKFDISELKPRITWSKVSGVEKYYVQRSASENNGYEDIFTVTLNEIKGENVQYLDTSAKDGEKYYYRIKYVGNGFEYNSIPFECLCKLATPTLSLSQNTETGKPKLSWNVVADATGYEIYRSLYSGGGYSKLENTDEKIVIKNGMVTFEDDSAVPAVMYYYCVRAVNDTVGAVSFSSEVKSIICQLAKPKLTFTIDTASGKPKLMWTKDPHVYTYRLYRADGEGGDYIQIATTNQYTVNGDVCEYLDKSVEDGKKYRYKLNAEKASANVSVELSECYKLPEPQNFEIKNSTNSGKPKLTWSVVANANGYEVYRSLASEKGYNKLENIDENIIINDNIATFEDDSAVVGKTYEYKVSAVNGIVGVSSYFSVENKINCNLAKPKLTATMDKVTGKPKITWKHIEKATHYYVYRVDEASGAYRTLTVVSKNNIQDTNSVTDTSAKPGMKYRYTVVAAYSKDEKCNSAYADLVSCQSRYDTPKITTVKTNVTNGKPQLSWTAVEGANGYKIYRYTSIYGYGVCLGSLSKTTCIDYTAQPNVAYYYRVQAVNSQNSSGSSKLSNFVVCRCDGIGELKLKISTNKGTGEPTIIWKNVDETSNYSVYRSDSKDEEFARIASVSKGKLAFTDNSAIPGKTYYYYVEATHQHNADKYVMATSDIKEYICGLAQPKLTVLSNEVTGKPQLNWSEVEGATHYYIYYSNTADGEYEQLAVTGETTYTHKTAEQGESYYYKVVAAVDTQIEQDYASLIEATVSIDEATSSCNLSWQEDENATHYYVYYSLDNGVTYRVFTVTEETSYTFVNKQSDVIYKVEARSGKDTAVCSTQSTAVSITI